MNLETTVKSTHGVKCTNWSRQSMLRVVPDQRCGLVWRETEWQANSKDPTQTEFKCRAAEVKMTQNE